MERSLRVIGILLIAACLAGAGAGAASAATFYVNQRGGLDTNPCSKAAPCETIEHTIVKARTVKGPNTIEVENEGVYEGQKITLNEASDKGLTINAEPGVVLGSKTGTIVIVGPAPESVKLTGFKFVDVSGAGAAIEAGRGGLVLENIELSDQAGSGDGIEVVQGASLTMKNSTVEMEGSNHFAVAGLEGSEVTLEGVKILNGLASADESGGVDASESKLSMTNSTVALESGSAGGKSAINAEKSPSVSLQNDVVKQSDLNAIGVRVLASPVTVNGLTLEMANSTSKQLGFGFLNTAGPSTISQMKVSGKWVGIGAFVQATQPTTITDSNIATPPLSLAPAMAYFGAKGGSGLLLQRSVVSSAKTAEASLAVEGLAEGTNATLDSSEVLGGLDAIKLQQKVAGASTLTISASTVDANVPGTAEDAPGVNGVFSQASTEPGATTKVSIQGSIVLEKQASIVEAGDTGSIACSYSAVPSQVQAAGSGSGGIACASGTNGNTEANPLSSLFPEPLSGYQLSPSSSAVDSVPASAVTLPFGLTPSTTDLAGNPRVVDGNGDCIAIQDKGALELQGHSAPCPMPPPVKTSTSAPKPLAGVITALTISPNAFSAAPKGATISRAKKAKKKYGAKISYRDSQAGTTTFTVLMPVTGRTQGRSCRKPSKANRHGRRCTLYKALGTFTHADVAGLNSLHFSGRLRGKKLAKGSYRLQAVPNDAAGNGAAVSVKFTIKK